MNVAHLTDIEQLLDQVVAYHPEADTGFIRRAYEYSVKAHEGQRRQAGGPYVEHPLAVAGILTFLKLDIQAIAAGLLHDTLEDTVATPEELEREFGLDVARLVDGVTKIGQIPFQSYEEKQAENFRKMVLSMADDIRVVFIKLADRLHNMQTLEALSDEKQKKIAQETMEIYAPLAERISMQKMKNELQDLAFAKLYPEERQSIINRLKFLKSDEGLIVDKIETRIAKTIDDFGIHAEVKGREKTPFSIWQKMKHKSVSFEQLYDVIAFRVVVNDVIDCYQALGIIHAAYHMVPGSFKDYISTPKDNGYRSLHTIVVGPDKHKIEIQIRTKEMHDINEWGVAAHWSYKQKLDTENTNLEGKQFKWVRELLKILENSETDEFLEHTKLEIYEDQVFCFTPKGEIIALPRGATPVDFAYALHSDIGNSCAGAKINGKLVPLRTKIENGDQVEITTSRTQTPSVAWEKFVVTGRAKSEVKRFIRLQQRKEYISLGRSILSKFFVQEDKEFKEETLKPALDLLQKKNFDDLYAAVGEGTISRDEVLKAVKNKTSSKLTSLKDSFSFFKFKKKKKEQDAVHLVGNSSGAAIHLAHCCFPIPGDQIIGVFQNDKGITIHTSDCDALQVYSNKPDKLVDVSWDKELKNDKTYIGRLRMIITHEPQSLATVFTIIAKQGANVNNVKITNRSQDFFEFLIDVELMGLTQLTNIMAYLRSQECVHSVERLKI